MNKRLIETIKIDRALVPQTIAAAADEDTEFYTLGSERKALFVIDYVAQGTIEAQVLVGTEEITIGLFEAEDSDGTNDQAITDAAGNAIELEVVGGVNAISAIVGTDGHADDDTVTVNGVVFTRLAAGFDAALRPLNWNSRNDLILAVNNHFDNIIASTGTIADDMDIDVVATERGNVAITVTEDIAAGTGYVGTVRATFTVEIDASYLSDGFPAVGLNIENATTPTGNYFAVCIRGDGRYNPPFQAVAGSIAVG